MVNLLSKSCSCILRSRNLKNASSVRKFGQSSKLNVFAEKYDAENYLNKKNRKYERGIYAYCLLVVPGTTFLLAIWQYNRKQWKRTLIEDMKLKTLIPACELPDDISDRRRWEYRLIRVKGEFDHDREMYMSSRSLIQDFQFVKSEDSFFSPFGKSHSNIGYVVVTPFVVKDANVRILVNRGWVPIEKKQPSTRLDSQITGEVEIEGIVRISEEKPRFISAEHDIPNRVFRYRDIEEMAEYGRTNYTFIDATESSTVPGGPIGGQTQVTMKDEHYQYMFTWLSIGLYLSYMWYRRFILKLS